MPVHRPRGSRPRLGACRTLSRLAAPGTAARFVLRLAAGSLLAAGIRASAEPVELLANPGLDAPYLPVNLSNAYGRVTGTMPSGWSDNSLFTGTHASNDMAEVTDGTVGGSAFRIVAGIQNGFTNGACVQIYQLLPGIAGRSYAARVWLKGSAPGTVGFGLRQSAAPYTFRAMTNCTVGTAWQSFTLRLDANIGENMRLMITLFGQPITLWIDEASVAVIDSRREFFASPEGSDAGDGTAGSPFQTLAKAVQNLLPGDTLRLRGGTYRETLAVTRSGTAAAPIVIAAADGEDAILSGCDVVTPAWTAVSNGIYSAAVGWNLGMGYNQVFVDGAMQHQARHPNHGTGDLFNPVMAAVTVTNGSAAQGANTISSDDFGGRPAGFFAGARFVGGVGQRWAWQTAVVSGSAGRSLTVDPATKTIWWWPDYSGTSNLADPGAGFVYGLPSLLDADGEWHLQTNALAPHSLHLRIAGGADPSPRTVEMKRRNWCVQITNQNHIAVRGIRTRAGAIQLHGTGNAIEDVEATHLSHFLIWAHGGHDNGGRPEGGGVVLGGTGNAVRRCTIRDTAGSGISTRGTGHIVTRDHVSNTDYAGVYSSPLVLDGDGDSATFNTLCDSGRDLLRPTGAGQTVMYNDLYGSGRLCWDLGAVYAWGNNGAMSNGARTRIAYNWVHDIGVTAVHSKGIYLDNHARNYDVDHNVVWNLAAGQDGIYVNSPTLGHTIDHNTLLLCDSYNAGTYTAFPDSNPDPGFWTTNNLGMHYSARNNLVLGTAAAVATNLVGAASRDFRPRPGGIAVDPAMETHTVSWWSTNGIAGVPPGFQLSMVYRFQLFTYEEIAGRGVVLPGVNDGYVGATPDSGAYEAGGPVWRAGVGGWDVRSPGVQTDPPTNPGVTRTTARGTLISAGAAATRVRLHWGPADAGTDAAAWSNVVDLGIQPTGGAFEWDLRGLQPGTVCFYRVYATNDFGEHWGQVQGFTTIGGLVWDAGGGANTAVGLDSNWQSDARPDLDGGVEVAAFGTAGATAAVSARASFAGIVLNRDANFALGGAGELVIGAGGIAVTPPSAAARTHSIGVAAVTLAADQTWTVSNNPGTAILNVTGAIGDGAMGFHLTKAGAGTLNLSGSNAYGGVTTVGAGILGITHHAALGSAAGHTIIEAAPNLSTGGQLRVSGGIALSEPITITGTTEAGAYPRAIAGISGSNTLCGDITLTGAGGIRIGPESGTLRIEGRIARAGADAGNFQINAVTGPTAEIMRPMALNRGPFQIAGGGDVVLHAAGSDIGNTVVFFGATRPHGPVLRLAAHDALPADRVLTLGTTSATAGADKGTLDLAGFDQTLGAIVGLASSGASPSPAWTRRVTNSAPGTVGVLTLGGGGGGGRFDGVISEGAGAIAVVKTGTGTQTLVSAGGWSGPTTVLGGVLALQSPGLADAADVYLAGDAELQLAFSGVDSIDELLIDGIRQRAGIWGAPGSGAEHTSARIQGAGFLQVVTDRFATWIGGIEGLSPADRQPDADPDRDGRSNMDEFVAGTRPDAADPGQLAIDAAGIGVRVSFVAAPAAGPGYDGLTRRFDLQQAAGMAASGPWADVPGSTDIDGAGQVVDHTNSIGAGAGFFRIRIRLP